MKYKALKDVADIMMGQSPDSSSYNGDERGLPFYQGNADFGDVHPTARVWCDAPKKIAKKNDILISVRAPIGALNYASEECCIGRGLAAISVKNDAERNYIYHLLKAKKTELNNQGTGSTFKAIGRSVLETIQIPEISEAERLVSMQLMDSVERIIHLRKKELIDLDNLIKARFIELFGKPEDDWEEVKIADICTDMRTGPFGSALHHDEFVDSGIFVLGIDNAVENRFSYNRMRYITEEKYEKLKRYTVHPGDVIITIMGTVGRSAVIPEDMPKAINTKHLACLTPNTNIVDSYFLTNAFQIHPAIRQQLDCQSKGAIMDGLNLTVIKGLIFRLPPLNLQKKFVAFYNQVDKSKFEVQKALDETQKLFDSLMQQYFG